jgi:hypothetical protein
VAPAASSSSCLYRERSNIEPSINIIILELVPDDHSTMWAALVHLCRRGMLRLLSSIGSSNSKSGERERERDCIVLRLSDTVRSPKFRIMMPFPPLSLALAFDMESGLWPTRLFHMSSAMTISYQMKALPGSNSSL